MLRLRKVELLGFKSFCQKTPITFSGAGITCIVGPNGCGKSNVVDAISWVLGEQSHKMLRAERMSDCIFNGTAKRPPLGIAEVTLTLVDPELFEAVAKVIDGTPEPAETASADAPAGDITGQPQEANTESDKTPENAATESSDSRKPWKKRAAEKPAIHLRPGEVVVGRRLYRSGQSEYLINGRVARLRDVQEIFMGIGLGPDSYAIIEQGRIGQILNSKPMDRRAIIEEAAGITMYKTKRRLAETKLEASKINLSRVNDILVEVEKQLASLKRQASKARRYAELREQMRGLLRIVLASKAEHLDIEAARLMKLLQEMDAAEQREASSVGELEHEQQALTARTYELDADLRQTQNLLGQTALDLDRAENRITFNREQLAQIESRATRLAVEVEQALAQSSDLTAQIAAQQETVSALRDQAAMAEQGLRESAQQVDAYLAEQSGLEARLEDLRRLANRLAEESARGQAESSQAEETAARHTAAETQRATALEAREKDYQALQARAEEADAIYGRAEQEAQTVGAVARETQAQLAGMRHAHEETSRRLEYVRQELSAERARHASIEQILSERAYTADAVQKLFSANGEHAGVNGGFDSSNGSFRAVGLLADYTEVREEYESAIEQFLHDELEYVVVESFDHARAGVSLLREHVGGRATFFVDSLNKLQITINEADAELPLAPGVVTRLDKLIEFRDPLGPAAKHFLTRLRTAYLVESAAVAEQMARDNVHSYFLTADGTWYHGRMVSGGRKGEAGPLALKRELRKHESESARLESIVSEQEAELSRVAREISALEARHSFAAAQHMEAEKSLVAATHQREHAQAELGQAQQRLTAEQEEIARLRAEAESARARAEQARLQHEDAIRARAAAETEALEGGEKLIALRRELQAAQDRVIARREELAKMAERLASAEQSEARLSSELAQASMRVNDLCKQQETFSAEKAELEASCEQLARQVEELRHEKSRLEERKMTFESEWEQARARVNEIEEALRTRRQSLEELRTERNQRLIEKARNDADRDYLRQTCTSELNAQPEELIAEQQGQLVVGEELVAAETNYNEMKARVEAMGAVNMMALEEFQECEQREAFLRRERDDLVQSIENTQLTIHELDQVSRQKFEEAFQFINAHFAIAFQSLFGGGTGEMRLSEPDSSGDCGIDIVAQPPGKRLQNVLLLSGGEKALTALALLIAVFRYQPSPFCILDEVDAPLDEANVGRFNRMLTEMSGQTQFIVVTHNRKTMEMGSVLYGVTMQEPGVSTLVSVKWEEAEQSETKDAAAASHAA